MSTLRVVVSGEKLYIGEFDGFVDDAISLKKSLEIREMFIPTESGQIHRMVNYVTIVPFDKTPHNILIKTVSAFIDIDEHTDTYRSYENYINQLRAENSNIQLVPPGATVPPNFSGKFGPMR